MTLRDQLRRLCGLNGRPLRTWIKQVEEATFRQQVHMLFARSHLGSLWRIDVSASLFFKLGAKDRCIEALLDFLHDHPQLDEYRLHRLPFNIHKWTKRDMVRAALRLHVNVLSMFNISAERKGYKPRHVQREDDDKIDLDADSLTTLPDSSCLLPPPSPPPFVNLLGKTRRDIYAIFDTMVNLIIPRKPGLFGS